VEFGISRAVSLFLTEHCVSAATVSFRDTRLMILAWRIEESCGVHREVSDGDCAKSKRHTTGGIPRWSPTLVLVARFSAYVWQSGRDAQFSLTYGRMC
jgi:hypothetical protein